jgi:hypothetical protein
MTQGAHSRSALKRPLCNLVQNGGFETGDFAGWTLRPGSNSFSAQAASIWSITAIVSFAHVIKDAYAPSARLISEPHWGHLIFSSTIFRSVK